MQKEINIKNQNLGSELLFCFSFFVFSFSFLLSHSINNYDIENRNAFREQGTQLLEKHNINYTITDNNLIELHLKDEDIKNTRKTNIKLKQLSTDKILTKGYIDKFDNDKAIKKYSFDGDYSGYTLIYGYNYEEDKYYFKEIEERSRVNKDINVDYKNRYAKNEHNIKIVVDDENDEEENYSKKYKRISNLNIIDTSIISFQNMLGGFFYLIFSTLSFFFFLETFLNKKRFINSDLNSKYFNFRRMIYKSKDENEIAKKNDEITLAKIKEYKQNRNSFKNKLKVKNKTKVSIDNS